MLGRLETSAIVRREGLSASFLSELAANARRDVRDSRATEVARIDRADRLAKHLGQRPSRIATTPSSTPRYAVPLRLMVIPA